jgi:hypothetical protein
MGDRNRLLVIANETIAAPQLLDLVRDRSSGGGDILLMAPALTSRLHYWWSDEDDGYRRARERLRVSLDHLHDAGISARGAVGDADPLLAMDDAVRTFNPTEIVVASHPEGRSNWLEHGLVAQARERFAVPIIHIEVTDATTVATRTAEVSSREAPAHERHRARDWLWFIVAGVLAVGGTVFTALFVMTGMSDTALVWWVIFGDLGLKAIAFLIVWMVFQRRPRADRLDV